MTTKISGIVLVSNTVALYRNKKAEKAIDIASATFSQRMKKLNRPIQNGLPTSAP